MPRFVFSACMFAMLALSIDAQANTFDRRTFFTFSGPVTLPGVTLPAGTYQFRIADESTSRKIVQVLNVEGTETYATVHSLPVDRPEAGPDPEIRFMETASGLPPAIEAWWYAGQTVGYQFLYPREQALRLAGNSTTGQPSTLAATSRTAESIAADLTPAPLHPAAAVQ